MLPVLIYEISVSLFVNKNKLFERLDIQRKQQRLIEIRDLIQTHINKLEAHVLNQQSQSECLPQNFYTNYSQFRWPEASSWCCISNMPSSTGRKEKVLFIKPVFPSDNTNFLSRGISIGIATAEFYKEFKKNGCKFGGVYTGPQPALVLVDLELIKSVMSKVSDTQLCSFTNKNDAVKQIY